MNLRTVFPGFTKIHLISEFKFLLYFQFMYNLKHSDDMLEITEDDVSDELLNLSIDFEKYRPLIGNFYNLVKHSFPIALKQRLQEDPQVKSILPKQAYVNEFFMMRNPIRLSFKLSDDGSLVYDITPFKALFDASNKSFNYVFKQGDTPENYALFYMACFTFFRLDVNSSGSTIIPGDVKFVVELPSTGTGPDQSAVTGTNSDDLDLALAAADAALLSENSSTNLYDAALLNPYIFVYTLWDHFETLYFNNVNIHFKYNAWEHNDVIQYNSLVEYYRQRGGLSRASYSAEMKRKEVEANLSIGSVCILYNYNPSKSSRPVNNHENLINNGDGKQLVVVQGWDAKHIDLVVVKNECTREKYSEILKSIVETTRQQIGNPDETFEAISYLPDLCCLEDLGVTTKNQSDANRAQAYAYDTLGIGSCIANEHSWLIPLGSMHDMLNVPATLNIDSPYVEKIGGKLYILPPYEHLYTLLRDSGVSFDYETFYEKFLKFELLKEGKKRPVYDEVYGSMSKDASFTPLDL